MTNSMSRASRTIVVVLGTVGAVALALRRLILPAVEEPAYEVERGADGLEIRDSAVDSRTGSPQRNDRDHGRRRGVGREVSTR
jgi:hypothetical protein